MADLIHDIQNVSGAPLQTKVLYAGDVYQGQPCLVMTSEEVNLVGDQNNAIHIDPLFGILLSGKLSISTPDQISIAGGYWRFNPLLLSCVPSTTPTPVPVLVKSTPNLFQNGSAMSSALSFLKSNSDIGGLL